METITLILVAIVLLYLLLSHCIKRQQQPQLQTPNYYTNQATYTPELEKLQDPLILLDKRIRRGKYGDVWLGVFNNKQVAVKVVLPKDGIVFDNELEVNVVLNKVQHRNILQFVDATLVHMNSLCGYALITEHHPKGSLCDYLQFAILEQTKLLTMIRSILSGVEYLHTAMPGKAAIAHCDLNTSSILLKDDGECAIADFGSCMWSWDNKKKVYPTTSFPRYMAPEFLPLSSVFISFDTLRRADMYSMGLIMWEVTRRFVFRGKVVTAEPFAQAYYAEAPDFPSCDDMTRILKIEKLRPKIPERWIKHDVLNKVSHLMSECWDEDPMNRPTAGRAEAMVRRLQELKFDECAVIV